jgi:hypothetical protein
MVSGNSGVLAAALRAQSGMEGGVGLGRVWGHIYAMRLTWRRGDIYELRIYRRDKD